METEFYHCKYCFKQFTPARRRVQKFCSNTCRSKNHHAKITISKLPVASNQKDSLLSKTKVEAMSLPGIANAAAGTLAVAVIKEIFSSAENKPATKKDLQEFVDIITERYRYVKNLPPRYDGALPYFDFDTDTIVYF